MRLRRVDCCGCAGSGSYAASKAALYPYAYDLAAGLGERGITVNVVAPGYVAGTKFFRGALSALRERALIAPTNTGRAGTPADVVGTVRWLASPDAAHITGQIIQVTAAQARAGRGPLIRKSVAKPGLSGDDGSYVFWQLHRCERRSVITRRPIRWSARKDSGDYADINRVCSRDRVRRVGLGR